jgi:hypothetical protein
MHLTLRNTIFSNWAISLLLVIPMVLWFKPLKQKFKAKIERIETFHDCTIYYFDLNNDGNSQRIEFGPNTINNNCIRLNINGSRGQINMNNRPTLSVSLVKADYDNNATNELYCLGIRNDSLFINQFEYAPPYVAKEFHVLTLPPNTDFHSNISQLIDLDSDGYKEVVFVFNAGFALQPRRIFAYSFAKGTLLESPLTGVKPYHNAKFFDSGNNNELVLIAGTANDKNYGTREVPYTDMHCWLLGYNQKLEFLFEPIKVTERKASVNSYPFRQNDKKTTFSQLPIIKPTSSTIYIIPSSTFQEMN